MITGAYLITWTGSDPDGDQLYYTLKYNIEDTGWVNIASDLTSTSYDLDTTTVSDSNSVRLRVIAEDTFGGEAIDESNAIFSIDNESGGNRQVIPGYKISFILTIIILTSLMVARKRMKLTRLSFFFVKFSFSDIM